MEFIFCEGSIDTSNNGNFIRCDLRTGEGTVLTQQQVQELFSQEITDSPTIEPPISTDGAFAIGMAIWGLFAICFKGRKLLEMLRFF